MGNSVLNIVEMGRIKFDTKDIRNYIISEVKGCGFWYNELQLQIFVALALEREFNDGYKVHLEYNLPKGWHPDFDKDYFRWGETPYFDIVLEQLGEQPKYIGIELKNKLKDVTLPPNNSTLKRFGRPIAANCPLEKIELIKDHSARDQGRYDFWKDVKRLELLKKHFNPEVIGGISIFVTNDSGYQKSEGDFKYSKFVFVSDPNTPKTGFLYWNFDTYKIKSRLKGHCPDLCKSTILQCGDPQICDNCGELLEKGKIVRPNFTLDNSYVGRWDNLGADDAHNTAFYCYSVLI